jgi:hypothetical protein
MIMPIHAARLMIGKKWVMTLADYGWELIQFSKRLTPPIGATGAASWGAWYAFLRRHMKILMVLLLLTLGARADFAFRDGDTVVFLGDSITAARGYTKDIEHYSLMRFPERRVRFVNAGKGGDTATGCLERLERDVFEKEATVVTVAFGINDIG